MKEFAKMLMVLESNTKAIRPITAALYVGTPPRDRERLKGHNPIKICHKSSKSRPIITIKVKIYFNFISVMPRHSL